MFVKRRDFIQKFIVGAVTAAFLARFLSTTQATAITSEMEQEKIKKELEKKYSKKEAEIAFRIIIKYLKLIKRGVISKGEAVKLCYEELTICPQTPTIAKELRKILKLIKKFKTRKREYLIVILS